MKGSPTICTVEIASLILLSSSRWQIYNLYANGYTLIFLQAHKQWFELAAVGSSMKLAMEIIAVSISHVHSAPALRPWFSTIKPMRAESQSNTAYVRDGLSPTFQFAFIIEHFSWKKHDQFEAEIRLGTSNKHLIWPDCCFLWTCKQHELSRRNWNIFSSTFWKEDVVLFKLNSFMGT